MTDPNDKFFPFDQRKITIFIMVHFVIEFSFEAGTATEHPFITELCPLLSSV